VTSGYGALTARAPIRPVPGGDEDEYRPGGVPVAGLRTLAGGHVDRWPAGQSRGIRSIQNM